MKDYEIIALARKDITKYVIHFTKDELIGLRALDRLQKILKDEYIRPTFALRRHRASTRLRPTIKGPYPAVCLAETPLWALVEMRNAELYGLERYSGYGIAYHSGELYSSGGRPAIYGDESLLGTRVQEDSPEYMEDREIYTDGLHTDHQHLWTNYQPEHPSVPRHPVDFRWEREWRIKTDIRGLPVVIPYSNRGAIIVERDRDIEVIGSFLQLLPADSIAKKLSCRIISLETVERQVPHNSDYGRIETWPEFNVKAT